MNNMKHKILMTLALLLMAVTGAWAQSTLSVVEFDVPADWQNNNSPVTAADLPGFKAVTLDEAKAWTGAPAEGYAILFYAFDGNKIYLVNYGYGGVMSNGTADFTKKTVFDNKSNGKFYYTAEITEWELKPDETGKNWILADMPASNIELQVEYYAESNLFLSKEALADKTSIAVKAGKLGVQFGEDGKSANTVTEGTAMTVTYNGTKKILGMKVEKKAAEPADKGHALSASAVGEIVGSDGKAYAVADKDNLPSGVTAVAMVAYKSGSNGLAIQLNSNPEKMKWAQAKTYAEGLTAVSGGTWHLPSKADWQNMFVGCAVSGDASASDDMNPIAGFKAKIAAAGITWLSDDYWTSTEGDSMAWMVGVNLDDSNAKASFGQIPSDFAALNVRACLAF